MARPSSRDRILDALVTVVLRDGSTAATLDAVSAEAEVSKGGLLYHFPSRDALFAGLHERLAAGIDRALAEAPTEPRELVEWYLRNPAVDDADTRSYAALIASVRVDASGDAVGPRLTDLFGRFFVKLHELDDPALVAEVEMIADGLFLRAILGLPLPDAATHGALVARVTRGL